MIRLYPDIIYFSMMDKQLNVIKTYYKDCVLRGLIVCFEGFIRLPFGIYVISP